MEETLSKFEFKQRIIENDVWLNAFRTYILEHATVFDNLKYFKARARFDKSFSETEKEKPTKLKFVSRWVENNEVFETFWKSIKADRFKSIT